VKSLVVSLALLIPRLLPAQTAPATFMDWGRVSSSIYSDPVMGVQLWIGTSLRSGAGDSRYASVSFAPDTVLAWADAAAVVIDPTAPPRDSTRVLATPPLPTLKRGSVRLLRRSAGAAWEDRVIISVEPTMSVNITARKPASTSGAGALELEWGWLMRPRKASTAARSTAMISDGISP
jgi:hypothetical protein